MRYGLPYVGSKNKIAARLVDFLPRGGVFVDLFAGGCAMTHAAMVSGKYRRFVANDLRGDVIRLFVDCAEGRRPAGDDWRAVTREEFRFRRNDPLIRLVWSFGNNGRTYIYNAETEPAKIAAHEMLVAGTVADRADAFLRMIRATGGMFPIKQMASLTRLQRLQSLGSLQSLGRLSRLTVSERDYAEVEIPPGAVVYADPPYHGADEVNNRFYGAFDYDRFDAWLRAVPFPVYVSGYDMPDDFNVVWQTEKSVLLCSGGAKKRTEKLFLHRRWNRGGAMADAE